MCCNIGTNIVFFEIVLFIQKNQAKPFGLAWIVGCCVWRVLLPQEAVHGPVLIPELACAGGVLFEEDTHAAVFQQGHGGVDRGAIEEQHRVLPSVAFIVADEDAHVAAFH